MTGRPRVVLVSHTYIVGANRRKLDLLGALCDLTVITPTRWRETLGVMISEPVASGLSYRLLTLPVWYDGRLARHFYNPFGLARVLRRCHPVLVHVEEEPVSLAFLELSAIKLWLHYRLTFFTWQNIILPATRIERFNLRMSDGAVAGNQAAADGLRAKRFAGPLAIAPQLGIDTAEQFSPPAPSAVFHIGYVGRLVAEKGLLVLLNALSGLGGDWSCTFVGAGPLEAQLRRLCLEHCLMSRVVFVGSMPHADVAEIMKNFDVLVLPSLSTPTWKEQFGHVLIEAMALGVPVVGSDSGAIPEVIGNAGITVPENDAVALRQALDRLQNDTRLRYNLAKQGRARAAGDFGHALVAQKTWNLWQAILN